MKYVRTKDGVFKVGDRETDICILTNHGYIYKQDILNQADAVKDLIEIGDLVVYYNTNSKRYEYIHS